MYMKWAADAIKNAESMSTNPEEFEQILAGYFKKYTPSEAMVSEYVFAADETSRPDVYDRTKPYVPVILCGVAVFTRIEVKNLICNVIFENWHGYMKRKDYEMLQELIEKKGGDLINVMIKAGAMTREEANKIFTEEELKELEMVERKEKKGFKEKMIEFANSGTEALCSFFRVFGLTLPKESLPWIRTVRAASYAITLLMEGIRRYKASYNMPQLPL